MVRSSVTTPKTIEEARRELAERGATTSFVCRPISHVECQKCGAESPARPSMLHALHRIENGEHVIVVLLRCPSCASLGTAVIESGEVAPGEEAGVLAALLDEGSPFVARR